MKSALKKATGKVIDLTKEFFYPEDLMTDVDSFNQEQISALSDKRTISRLLFYRSYVEETEENIGYYIQADGRVGIVFRLYPPPYLTTDTEKDIVNMINSVVLDDTIVNFSTYASKDVHKVLDEFAEMRANATPNVRNPDVLKEYTADLMEKFQKWTTSSIAGNESDMRVRNFVHTLSVLFPYDTDEFVINQQYNQLIGMFKSYQIRPFKPDEFVPYIREIINPSLDKYPLSNDSITTLNKQMTKDSFIRLNDKTKLLEMPDNWKARVLTTDKYPREVDIFTFQNVFFSVMGDDFQLNLPNPFLLSLTIRFKNVEQQKKAILKKARWNLGQLSGMPPMVYKKKPQIKERRDENEEVIQYIEQLGETPLESFFSLTLFEKDTNKMDQYTALIKKALSKFQVDGFLKKKSFHKSHIRLS